MQALLVRDKFISTRSFTKEANQENESLLTLNNLEKPREQL